MTEQQMTDPDEAVQEAVAIYDHAYREAAGMHHTGFGAIGCTDEHRAAIRAVLSHFGGITQQQEEPNG